MFTSEVVKEFNEKVILSPVRLAQMQSHDGRSSDTIQQRDTQVSQFASLSAQIFPSLYTRRTFKFYFFLIIINIDIQTSLYTLKTKESHVTYIACYSFI